MRSRVLFCFEQLLGVGLLVLSFAPLTAASAEEQAGAGPSRALTSLIDFAPNRAQFQGEVASVVRAIEEGGVSEKEKRNAEAKASYQQAAQSATALISSLSRGYHDELYFLLGFAKEKLGDDAGAARAYDASLKLKRTNVLVLFRHAYVSQRAGKCDVALPEFREVLWQTKAEAHEVLFLQGECLLKLGKPEEAAKAFQAARDKNSHYTPAVRRLVAAKQELMTKTSDPKLRTALEAQIAADLGVISQQNPDDRESGLLLASMLLRGADPLLAKQRLRQAESLAKRFAEGSSFSDVKSVRLLFDAQRKQGDLAAAEQTLQRGLKVTPDARELKEASQQLAIDKGLTS